MNIKQVVKKLSVKNKLMKNDLIACKQEIMSLKKEINGIHNDLLAIVEILKKNNESIMAAF